MKAHIVLVEGGYYGHLFSSFRVAQQAATEYRAASKKDWVKQNEPRPGCEFWLATDNQTLHIHREKVI